VPVVGSVAAVADAGLYAYEGDDLDAAMSLIGAIPGGEILGKAAEAAHGAAEAFEVGADVAKVGEHVAEAAEDTAKVADDVVKAGEETLTTGEEAVTAGEDAGSGFGDLSKAEDYGVQSYDDLKLAKQGTDLQAHHLFEKRFAGILEQDPGEMSSIAVTNSEHQVFTNAWRREIPCGPLGTGMATVQSVTNAARRIYADYPAILSALRLE